MDHQNGQLVMKALQHLGKPSTANKIVALIADYIEVHPNDVKESVERILKTGVRYGFMQYSNRKFSLAPVEDDSESSDDIDPDEENLKTNHLEV